jgi:hypothetical protein
MRAKKQIAVGVLPERIVSASRRVRLQILGPRGGIESTVYLTVQDSALLRSLLHRCEQEETARDYEAIFSLN